MEAITTARVHEHLGRLKLDRVAAVLDHLAEEAAREQLAYTTSLAGRERPGCWRPTWSKAPCYWRGLSLARRWLPSRRMRQPQRAQRG